MRVETQPLGQTPEGHNRYAVEVNHKIQGYILAIMERDSDESSRGKFSHYVLEKDFHSQGLKAERFDNKTEIIIECAKRNGRTLTFEDINGNVKKKKSK